MAQSVKHLTLNFSSGHDLTVCEIEACHGFCADSKELLGILSVSLSASPLCVLSLSLKINKKRKKRKEKD